MWYSLMEIMKTARSDVRIITPYLICSGGMYDDLRDIPGGSAAVSMILNSPQSGANIFGSAVFLNDRDKISPLGMDVYEYYGYRSCHAKAMTVGAPPLPSYVFLNSRCASFSDPNHPA